MDISDGIVLDAERLAQASQVGLSLQLEKLPFHSSLQLLPIDDAIKFASQGDDYELLFSVEASKVDSVTALSRQIDLALTCIGQLTDNKEHLYTLNNKKYDITSKGYAHF